MNDMTHPVAVRGKALVGLIGAGLQQSLTPSMQEDEARHHGLALHYQLIDLDAAGVGIGALPGLIDAAKVMGFAGLNITYPCKQAVIPLLDALDDEARAMGAVNTVVIRGGKTKGYNTDGSGWAMGLQRALPQADLSHVVLLGAGGAGAAIAHAVLTLGAGQLWVVDQDADKAASLADALNRCFGPQRADAQTAFVSSTTDAAAAWAGATGLIHATPTGMNNVPGVPLDVALLHKDVWVSEIVYSPIETGLLKAARAVGCATSDGGGMAVGQAVGAFRLFTGLEPDPVRMDASFRRLLAARGH